MSERNDTYDVVLPPYLFTVKETVTNMNRTFTAVKSLVITVCLIAVCLGAMPARDALAASVDLSLYTTTDGSGRRLIHLPAGTYTITRPILLPSNTTLEGEGESTILKATTSFAGSRFITNADFTLGNRDIIVRDLKIELALPVLAGNASGILRFEKLEHLEIKNVTIALDSPMYGIDLARAVHDAVVEGCTINNVNKVSGGGIMIRNSEPTPAKATSDIVIQNNRIESTTDEPIAAFGWQGMVENIRIENNTIRARTASFGISVYGIDSPKHTGLIRDVQVVGNRVSGSNIGGIAVKGGARSIEVTGNSIEATIGDGIFVHSGGKGLPEVQDITIRENTVRRAGRHCIFSAGSKVLVEGNILRTCGATGIYAAGDVSVSRNDIFSAKPGILVDGGNQSSTKGNILRDAGQVVYLNGNGTTIP
jgi:nitrous oxidase accessory protein NosD